jgi:pimeloyl-ACP methyl ester carboxylesterase
MGSARRKGMTLDVNKGYEGVPKQQVNHLLQFRSEHPCKHIDVAGVEWEFISSGNGTESLLVLPGGLRVAEAAFRLIQMFEDSYRVITPTYPPLGTMNEIVDGIATILDVEQVSEAFILGQSYGGAVAQVLIQRHPSRVRKLILSGTAPLIVVGWKRVLTNLLLIAAVLLPERIVMDIFSKALSPVITVQALDRTFWKAYLNELFTQHLTKADILSHFRTTRDAQIKYIYKGGEESSWHGDVLVIWGEDDHLRNERARRGMLAIYPQAQIRVIAGAGHTVALSEPEKYAAIVKEFLDKRG